MTDNEIIKALECCIDDELGCTECPALGVCQQDYYCPKSLALYQITRQKAEIERLNETLDNIIRFLPACTDCEGKTPYGERTEKCVFEIDPSYCGKKAYELFVKMRTELETAKAEAVKEFAEIIVADYPEMEYYLDNIKKEMVGEG